MKLKAEAGDTKSFYPTVEEWLNFFVLVFSIVVPPFENELINMVLNGF